MKKIYGILLSSLLAGSALSVDAQKTVKFCATESGVVTASVGESYYPLTAEGVDIEFADDYQSVILRPDSGWKIGAVSANSGYSTGSDESPTDLLYLSVYDFTDKDVVTVNVLNEADIPGPSVTFVGLPGSFGVANGYSGTPETVGESGQITFKYGPYDTYKVVAGDDYLLDEISDRNGNSYYLSSPTTCYVSTYSFNNQDVVVDVKTKDIAEMSKGTYTITVEDYDVAAKRVNLRDSYYNYTLLSSKPNGSTYQILEGYSYALESADNDNLYQLELNGEVIESNFKQVLIDPKDGDKYVIRPNYPAIDIPVKISFAEGCEEDVLFYVTVNEVRTEDWKNADWTLPMGKVLNLAVNPDDYNNIVVFVNNESVYSSTDSYDRYVKLNILDEAGYDIVISGEKRQPATVIVRCENWENLKVKKGYSDNYYELTGEETTLVVPPSSNRLILTTVGDYLVASAEAFGAVKVSEYNSNEFIADGDGEIEVELEPIVRDLTMVVYRASETGNEYNNPKVVLSPYDYSSGLRSEVPLQEGYNLVNYGKFDYPFGLQDSYLISYVYFNGELLVNNWGTYSFPDECDDWSVLKLYHYEPVNCKVQYDIKVDGVAVYSDLYIAVENPTEQEVFNGTQIRIVPVSSMDADQKNEPFAVSVNGESVASNEKGDYIVTVNEDCKIVVDKGESGVNSVSVDAPEAPVYNLQGIRVSNTMENLPAGLYIRAGKKVVVK